MESNAIEVHERVKELKGGTYCEGKAAVVV